MSVRPRVRPCRFLLTAILAAVVLGGLMAGAASAAPRPSGLHLLGYPQPGPEQSIWRNYEKTLKLTLIHTEKYLCKDFSPAGKADLYPYYVPTHGYEFEWRNASKYPVYDRPETTTTGDMDGEGIALSIGETLATSKGYPLKFSFECQSNDPDSPAKISRGKPESSTADSATVGFNIHREAFEGNETFKYYVEYGTTAEVYTHRSEVVTTSDLSEATGGNERKIIVSGLDPSTTYHYRVAVVSEPGGTSYSGADQTFTTAAAPDKGAGEQAAPPERDDLLRMSFRHVAQGEGMEVVLPPSSGSFLFSPPMTFAASTDHLTWGGGKEGIQVNCAGPDCGGTATAAVDAAPDQPLVAYIDVPKEGEVIASWAGGPSTLIGYPGGRIELQPQ